MTIFHLTFVFVSPFLQAKREPRGINIHPLEQKNCPCSLFTHNLLTTNSLCKNKSQSMGNYLDIIFLYRIICFCNVFAVCLIKAASRSHSVILSSILISPQHYSWLPLTVKNWNEKSHFRYNLWALNSFLRQR